MDYGYFGFNHGALHEPDDIGRVLVAAEQLGYESIWTGEHVVLVAGRPLAMEAGSVSLDEEHTPAAMAETTPRAVRTALEQLIGAGGAR